MRLGSPEAMDASPSFHDPYQAEQDAEEDRMERATRELREKASRVISKMRVARVALYLGHPDRALAIMDDTIATESTL